MKVAVIGIGSNSVRMLVAEVTGNRGVRIRRDRAGTRLFAGLDAQRNLSREAMDKTVEAVRRMAEDARREGAAEVRLFATSATRDAANAGALAALLRAEAQVELEICSGETEAELSFLGATDGGRTGVIDIGGGSTELIVGQGLEVACALSCQMGAVRLFRMQPIGCAADVAQVRATAERILREGLAAHPAFVRPDGWIGTGGTFTTLAAMVRGVHWTERTYMHGTRLSREDVTGQALLLADMPMEQRLNLPGLQPNRADIVVHGICILMACMEHLDIPEITVSEYGNLDGYLKRAYRLTGGLH